MLQKKLPGALTPGRESGIVVKIALAIAALLVGGTLGFLLSSVFGSPKTPPPAARKLTWVAAAPGRVEPRSGEYRIAAGHIGRVADVMVRNNDKVEEGELLVRLDDDEARARLAAAETDVSLKKRERDTQGASTGREDVRKAEDNFYAALRAVTDARYEFDEVLDKRRKEATTAQTLDAARSRLALARDRLQRERIAFAVAQAKPGLPAPNRLEAALTMARADVAVADALLEKTRIRSPIAGTVLQMNAKLGELVAPQADQPLAVIGDMSVVRVKAELDEADLSKVRLGQRAFVKSPSFPGRQFDGRVTGMAPSLAAPRIGARGPRRASDVDVLEVTLELEPGTPLLPGMRIDAFFRNE